PLTQELAKRGHDVVVITTDPAFPKGQAPKNLTEIDLHDMSYATWGLFMAKISEEQAYETRSGGELDAFQRIFLNLFERQTQFGKAIVRCLQESSIWEDFTRNQKKNYLSFGSNVDPAHFPPVKIQSIINAVADLPYNVLWKWNDDELPGKMENIKISKWFPQSDLLRHPNVKLFITQGGLQSTDEAITAGVPLIGVPIMGDQMYNVEKYVHHKIGLRLNLKDLDETSLKIAIKTVVEDKSYRENIVRLRTLMNDQPMSPLDRAVWWTEHVLRHGGARHLRAPAANMPWTQYYELDLDLKNYLENSKNGVIYISFGTNVDTNVMPQEKVQNIIKAFSELPYDVLWKWNSDELQGKTENIRISKWFPQSDLLRHPKIKLFITQGGLQSTDEALTAGVPLIGIPMLGDQWFNVEKYVHHKIGLQLEMGTLEVESFKNAIETVIGDKSYRENIVRLRTLMNDQPLAPLERTVWWTEHVLRHGGARHLRAPAANMPWAQYYELDLVLLVLSTALAVIVLSSLVIYKLVKFVLSQVSNSKKLKSS
ncbi:hypothetical protein MSG28_012672, partial [Choristoneura fumiferana]